MHLFEREEVSCTEIASIPKAEPKQAQPAPKEENQTPKVSSSPDSEELIAAASGTGFAVSNQGHVITNNHVIHGCEDVRIHHNGDVIRASVISRDETNDLAIIKGEFKPRGAFPFMRKTPN